MIAGDRLAARRIVADHMHAARRRARRCEAARKWLLLAVIVAGTAVAATGSDHPLIVAGLAIGKVTAAGASVIVEQSARDHDRNADHWRDLALVLPATYAPAAVPVLAAPRPEPSLSGWLDGSPL